MEGLLEDGLALWLVALRNAPSCCSPPQPPQPPTAGGAPAVPAPAAAAAAAAVVPPRMVDPAMTGVLEALLAPLPALAAIAESSTEHLPLVGGQLAVGNLRLVGQFVA